MGRSSYSTSFGDIELKVTSDQMNQTAGELASKVQNSQSLFEEMQSILTQTSSYWGGKTATVVRAAFILQAENFNALMADLQQYSSELETITLNYELTESAATEDAQSLQSNILS